MAKRPKNSSLIEIVKGRSYSYVVPLGSPKGNNLRNTGREL
jgi:hypothetical protein